MNNNNNNNLINNQLLDLIVITKIVKIKMKVIIKIGICLTLIKNYKIKILLKAITLLEELILHFKTPKILFTYLQLNYVLPLYNNHKIIVI